MCFCVHVRLRCTFGVVRASALQTARIECAPVSQVIIDGTTSHTHDPSRKLQSFLWEDVTSGEVVGKNQLAKCFYPFGTYTMALTVTDDGMEALATSQTIVVAPESEVPGTHLPPSLLALPCTGAAPPGNEPDAAQRPLHATVRMRCTLADGDGGNACNTRSRATPRCLCCSSAW